MGYRKKLKTLKSINCAKYVDCEEMVLKWYNEQIRNDLNITIPLIRNKIIEEVRIKYPSDHFKASKGFVVRFLKRHNLVKRKITSSGRGVPKDSIESVKEYLGEAYKYAQQFESGQIINFDQTSLYMDTVGNYTIRPKGKFYNANSF